MKGFSNIFRTVFLCLIAIFTVSFLIEFIGTVTGHPMTDIEIIGLDLTKQDTATYLLRSLISALFISGFFNFFLTVKAIKDKKGVKRLPAVLVVIMTILFPVELILSIAFVIPNMIIFGILSLKKHE